VIAGAGDPITLHMPTGKLHPAQRVTLLHWSTGPTAGHSLSIPEVGHGRSSSLLILFVAGGTFASA
jgi:hypothetical protein